MHIIFLSSQVTDPEHTRKPEWFRKCCRYNPVIIQHEAVANGLTITFLDHFFIFFGGKEKHLLLILLSVSMYGQFTYKGLHCQLLELLECNIRSVIFKNERQGLSPWATQKFARDVLMWVVEYYKMYNQFVLRNARPLFKSVNCSIIRHQQSIFEVLPNDNFLSIIY